MPPPLSKKNKTNVERTQNTNESNFVASSVQPCRLSARAAAAPSMATGWRRRRRSLRFPGEYALLSFMEHLAQSFCKICMHLIRGRLKISIVYLHINWWTTILSVQAVCLGSYWEQTTFSERINMCSFGRRVQRSIFAKDHSVFFQRRTVFNLLIEAVFFICS